MGGRVISGRVLTAFSHRPLDGPCGTRSCATHALTLSREGKSLSLSPQTRAYQIRISQERSLTFWERSSLYRVYLWAA
jgi:hypothetical protein